MTCYLLASVTVVVLAFVFSENNGLDGEGLWWIWCPYIIAVIGFQLFMVHVMFRKKEGNSSSFEVRDEYIWGWNYKGCPFFICEKYSLLDRTFTPLALYLERVIELTLLTHLILVLIIMFPLLVMMAFMLLFTVITMLLFSIVAIVYAIILGFARIADSYIYRTNTRFFICPACGKKFDRSEYYAEGYRLDNLRPSKYGVFHTQVEDAEISCFGRGRHDLNQMCPECHARPILREGKPTVFSLAGGPQSGKTYFINAVLAQLAITNGNDNVSHMGMFDSHHIEEFNDFIKGKDIVSDMDWMPPVAVAMDVNGHSNRRILYMFDVNGKFFTSSGSQQDLQFQYPYTDGIVFMIDPTGDDPCHAAFDYYNVFILKYRESCMKSISKRIHIPIAIVFSRADRNGSIPLGKELSAVRSEMGKKGYEELITAVERDFYRVGYFSCDLTDEHGGISVPVIWLCDNIRNCDIGKLF